ncbi:MAG: hypothetical protein HOP12_01335 [Candidatus Eisenbacteria bacterium]|uniref:PIG-L family deacetylase n=1 Tax=Eiseniibacteriota bacterium TaxID=2212470 RepID=A0A849SMY1_UNCEI|nr:hypothetical protein [Candidatus Eisenbacteria bacterium]
MLALLLVLMSFAARAAHADPNPAVPLDAARLRLTLEKLQVMGSALFVAAHPDDENTAFLAWLANGRKVRTGYLSITRGDGGQNLIGSDVGERLGAIRTQELLAARRIDGAEQMFTRAIDFGYSKGPDETLEIWGREAILSDVVRAIRRFRPDVIVTRFPTDGGGGHGHHTASAILAEEAFAAAADPARFPEQIAEGLTPWGAKRLVWNAFRFGASGPDTTRGRLRVDVGAYDALLARSYTELAGESRSMHKSQGFGSAERRGAWENTFEHRLGSRATTELFEGVDLSWKRVAGGERVAAALARALKSFDPAHPRASLPALLDAREAMAKLPDDPLVESRRRLLDEAIRGAAGLWIDAIAARPLASPGSTVRVVLSVLDRGGVGVKVAKVSVVSGELIRPKGVTLSPRSTWIDTLTHSPDAALTPNVAWNDTFTVLISAGAALSQPYWLASPPIRGASVVREASLIGTPESAPATRAMFELEILGHRLAFEQPVVHRWTDPVQGERYRTFDVAPPVRLRFDRDVERFAADGTALLKVVVGPGDVPVEGSLDLSYEANLEGDAVATRTLHRSLDQAGDSVTEFGGEVRGTSLAQLTPSRRIRVVPGSPDTTLEFRIQVGDGPKAATTRVVYATFLTNDRLYNSRVVELDYAHIPIQTLAPPASIKLVQADIAMTARRVGYVMGSGDFGADALRELGAEVTLLTDKDLESAPLQNFDAIVIGVRAYNTRPRVLALQPRLLDYVAAGGRLVTQYQTADNAMNDRLGPFPFRISRDRVTVEGAEIRMPKPDHALLSKPNRIGAADFDGWVQERGLYFASPFDPRYDAVLASNDPGEPSRDGGLLYARHGKGVFIYAAYAFFRQLPAGVPGAWRLFANLVSPER